MTEFKYLDNKKLIFLCLLITVIISMGLYFPYANFLALIIIVYSIFKLEEEDILCIILFLLSFSPIFKLKINGFTFFNIVIFISLIRVLIKNKFTLPRKSGLLLIYFSLYAISISFSINIIECLTVLCSLTLAALLYRPDRRKFNLKKVTIFTTWGVLLTSCLALFGKNIPRLSSLLNKATIRLDAGVYYYRFSGLMENPNYYTLLPSLLLSMIVILVIKRKTNFIDYIYFIGLTIFGFMSVSQSFIITFIIMFIMFFITLLFKSFKRSFIYIFLLIILCMVAYKFLDKNTIEVILLRIHSNFTADGNLNISTSGRDELWKYYIVYLFDNVKLLFFGAGLGAGNLWIGASHNYYIDILYYLGIIGGILYCLCLFNIFGYKKYCIKKPKIYQFLPLMIFLIRAFARNLILSEQLTFMLIICSIAICEGNTKLDFKAKYKFG